MFSSNESEMKVPEVSVLMSVYNGGEFLESSIDSILSQSFGNFEFIIINDASSDKSLEIIKSFDDPRIVVVENKENLGLILSLNKGLGIAKGKYIARQDADDISYPTRLESEVKHLKENEKVGLLGTSISLVDGNGSEIAKWANPQSSNANIWLLFFNTCVYHPTSMYHRDLALSIGGYSVDYKYAEDYKLWSDISKVSEINNLQELLLDYRVHDGAVSTLYNKEQSNIREKISSENVKSFLSNVLSEHEEVEQFQLLSQVLVKPSYLEIKTYLLTLKRFFDIFAANCDLNSKDKDFIFEYISERLTGYCSELNYFQKIKLLLQLKSIVPSEGISLGLLARVLIPENIKLMIKKMFNKSTGIINR